MSRLITASGSFLLAIIAPVVAFAHEVYVLHPDSIRDALAADSPNPFTAYLGNEYNFYFWGLISAVTMLTVLAASAFHLFERQAAPLLSFLKHFAHILVRLTVAITLISFGLAGKFFGLELHLFDLFGALTWIAEFALIVLGVLVLAGLFTRIVALVMIAFYVYALVSYGTYILTYVEHLGAYMLLAVLGSGPWALDRTFKIKNGAIAHATREFVPYMFPVLRMSFGLAIMGAALYAKFIHSELALHVVDEWHLTDYFPFDPLFIVLGAFIIEFLAGLMMFLGIAIRWTGLFLIFWLTLAELYFWEPIWPHLALYGLGLAIFCHGYDRLSLEGLFLKRGKYEPVL